MTHINFLPMISVHCQETRLWELIKWSANRKCFDLLSNSLNSFFKEIYRDQFGEFVCGYWGLMMTVFKTDPSTGWTERSHLNTCSEFFFFSFSLLAKPISYGLKRKAKQVIDKDENNFVSLSVCCKNICTSQSLYIL